MLEVSLSWSVAWEDSHLQEWRVYASRERDAKGEQVGTAPAAAREAVVTLPEGDWWVRVLGWTKGGTEEPWETSRSLHRVSVQETAEDTPSAPANVSLGAVDGQGDVAVAVDPLPASEPPQRIQVLEGPDADRAKLVGEVLLPPGGAMHEGIRQPRAATMPAMGSGESSTRTVLVRGVTYGGRPGDAVSRTLTRLARPAFHELVIASVNASAGTAVGFPTPTTADLYELVAGDGYRLLRVPAHNFGSWSDWGTIAAGGLAEQVRMVPYVHRAVLEMTGDFDLGADVAFVLDVYDECQRKTAVGAWTATPVHDLTRYPMLPSRDVERRDANTRGPDWLAREIRHGGQMRRPVEGLRWEFVVGTSTPLPATDSDYKPVMPGMVLKGRYVRLRLVIDEPVGWHQIKTGNIRVAAHVQKVWTTNAGTPQAAVAAPPGSMCLDTTNERVYVKKTGLGSTGWVAHENKVDPHPTYLPRVPQDWPIPLWTYGQDAFSNGTDGTFVREFPASLPGVMRLAAYGDPGALRVKGVLLEAVVPAGFDAASHALKIRVRARYVTASNTADTISALAYLNGAGSNLVTSAAQNLGSALAYFDIEIDESGLAAGDHLVIYLRVTQNDTGGAGSPEAEVTHCLLHME